MPRKTSQPSRTKLLLVSIVIAVAVAAAYLIVYHENECPGVSGVCLTTNWIYVNKTAPCDLEVRILAPNGMERARVSLEDNVEKANISPGIAPGDYRVLVYEGDRLLGEYDVHAYPPPGLASVSAVALPNGTILVNPVPRGKPCGKPLLVTAILVRVNGTDYKFTGPWDPWGIIRLQVNTTINPYTTVDIIVWDNVSPQPYRAAVAVSK